MLVIHIGRRETAGLNDVVMRRLGFLTEQADSGRDGFDFLRAYDYDIALIDFALPDMTGLDAIARARRAGLAVPAIILAPASLSPGTAAAMLDAGADDLVRDPFTAEELAARMRAVIRRSQGHPDCALRCGRLELSVSNHRVKIDGCDLRVSRREFAVLELLLLRRNTVLKKSQIIDHIYGGADEPEMKVVDVMVCRLRKKLVTAGLPDLIETVWGCGYRIQDPALEAPIADPV